MKLVDLEERSRCLCAREEAARATTDAQTRPINGGIYKQLEHTTTNAAGAWTLNAPRGSSRRLFVTPDRTLPPANTTAVPTIAEAVTPTLTLHIATPGNAILIFSGHLAIVPLGHPRPLVIIETPGPHGWEAVGAPIRTDRHGAYHYTYRSSPLTVHRTFKFRAVTPATPLWQSGKSPTIAAAVR